METDLQLLKPDLENLLSNSFKFTEKGIKLRITRPAATGSGGRLAGRIPGRW